MLSFDIMKYSIYISYKWYTQRPLPIPGCMAGRTAKGGSQGLWESDGEGPAPSLYHEIQRQCSGFEVQTQEMMGYNLAPGVWHCMLLGMPSFYFNHYPDGWKIFSVIIWYNAILFWDLVCYLFGGFVVPAIPVLAMQHSADQLQSLEFWWKLVQRCGPNVCLSLGPGEYRQAGVPDGCFICSNYDLDIIILETIPSSKFWCLPGQLLILTDRQPTCTIWLTHHSPIGWGGNPKMANLAVGWTSSVRNSVEMFGEKIRPPLCVIKLASQVSDGTLLKTYLPGLSACFSHPIKNPSTICLPLSPAFPGHPQCFTCCAAPRPRCHGRARNGP